MGAQGLCSVSESVQRKMETDRYFKRDLHCTPSYKDKKFQPQRFMNMLFVHIERSMERM